MTQRDSRPLATPSIAIPQELLDAIDREAKAKGEKRSVIVRDALRLWLRINGTQPGQRAS